MPDSADGSLAPVAGARHHRRELVQALRTIERMQEALATAGDRATPPGPVAVTGIGCRFPGGVHDPESFWRLLCDGVDATGEFPAARADATPFYDADPEAPGKAHVIRGGFLSGPVDRFEPAVFGISPREAVGMDPQQRLTLEVAWEALERSGYSPDGLEGSATGVFLGVSTTDYVRLRQQTGDIRDVDSYQLIGEPSFIAGRISYTLGLMGPSKVVDTACSSSLVALHDACQALRLGECDMALAGGVNLMLAPYGFVLMSKFRALSADGRCKTFDAAADGYGRGEGAGIVVLKRLADAQAAGDPILAVIRGTAVNHDGRSSGLSVPNPASQQAVLRQALAAAQAEPSEIGYVEAHGTGTALGDPIELRALEAVIGRHHANGSPLLVGSVKTNVGHLESAAGAAGLIKLILCLQHGEIPPHLHFRQPNPNVDWDRLHIDVTSTSRHWPDGPRVGGVSSFGASGTNAHAIVSEPPPRPPGRPGRSWNVFTLSARTQDSLRESAARHAAHLDDHPDIPLADLCYTTQVGRPRQRHGLAVVADSPRRIQSQLQDYASGGRAAVATVLPQARHRKVCWLFTGQGAQRVGMARELRDEPAFRQAFERCAGLLDKDLAQPLESVLWPGPGQPSPIGDTRYTQPALFALEYALAQLWEAWGIRPSILLGHSVGEITAACVAGVFRLEDAAALVSIRARLMSALPPGGAMAAVTGDEQTIRQALAGHQDVVIAGINGPDEIVLSGAAGELDAVIGELGRLGLRASRLAVSHAFHSPLIGPVLGEFREAISGLTFSRPRVPLVSNVTGRLWTAQEVGPDYWVRQAASPVLFRAGVRAVHEEGVRTFLELGPAPVLCGLGARSLSDQDTEFIPSLRPGTSDLQVLAQAAGLLSLRGARVDWPAFHGGDRPRRVTLPSTPWHGDSFWFKPAAPVSAAAGRLEGVGLRLRNARPTYELSPDDGAWDRRAHVGEAGQADLQLGALTAAAIAAAGDGLGGSWHCAEDAVLCGTVLPRQEPQTVQLSVLEIGDDRAICEFRGITEAAEKAGAPWRLVARIALRRRLAAVPRRRPVIDPAQYPRERPVDSSTLPAASADAIDQVLAGDRPGDVLVALVPGAAGWAAVADAATAAMAWAGTGDPPARMAAGLATMSCADPSRVRYVRGRGPERGTAGHAEFFDADGGWLGGAHATPRPAAPDAPASEPWRDPAELLYRVDWPEAAGTSPAPDEAASLAGQGYLLFADRHGAAESIAGQLRSAGATAVVAPVPLARAGGEPVPDAAAVGEVLDSWLATTPAPARVVVCTGLDAPVLDETTREAIEEFTAYADLLVITLTQQLAARPRRDPVKVTLLTRGAVATEPAQAGHSPLAATFWGLGRVLALEHPDHWGGLIDLDPAIPAVKSARLLEALVRSPAEDEQALRGERRLVSRLAPAPVPGTAPSGQRHREPPVRPDGTYLITGAFGGIGVALAHWLGRAGAGRLVLLARSRLPARSQWDGELEAAVRSRVEAVRSLERLGVEVEVVACDVTDEAAMTRLFRKLRDGRRPLRGVVHAAGVSAPQFVRDVRPEAYRAVWRPKVIGGWLTHRLSEGAPLDFFLGFSSIAATWGSQHLASYAAGNAFLTGLAHQRVAAGNPGLAVEWGPWASNSGLFGEDVMEFLKSTGLRPLAPDQCLHLLGALLDGGEPHHVVCAADWSVFKPVMEARIERPLLAGIAADGSPEAVEPTELRAELLAIGDENPSSSAIRGGLLSGYLRTVGAEILGVAPDEIDPKADLMDGGLDSVMVMDIVRRCKRDLGLAVKASKLFERTTLDDWADLLMEQFGWARDPAGPAPSPEGTARPSDAGAQESAPGADTTVGDPADPAWLARDVSLDPRIRPAGPAPVITAPHDILLTGSTGFIGAYLLSELLAATPATVHCLVRCGDAADGRQRIRDNFARYLPWPAGAEDRIRVVRGDLSDRMLGLPAGEFSALADRVGAIIHNGAWVNFSYTYDQLRPANVRGTEEILRLAAHAAPIPVHHVSTYGIWGLPAGDQSVIGEDDDIAGAGRLVTGYVQSKWAAERLVELARERGVGVNVYRPGRVLGDSRTGACLTTHFTTRVIKGCIEMGIAPQVDLAVEMTPVDYVAAAMVGIAFSGRPLGSTYHLVNGHKMRFSELTAILRRRGWPVEPVPVRTWWDALRRSYGEQPNELHPVMDVVEEFVVGGEEAIDYGVANTDSALDGTRIVCPPLDERLLSLYLDWMSASGYLPVPRHAQGAEQA